MDKVQNLFRSEVITGSEDSVTEVPQSADLLLSTEEKYEDGEEDCWTLDAEDVRKLRKQLQEAEFEIFGRVD